MVKNKKNLKNSKFKNVGIIFELLTRQITSDLISNKESAASNIIKKYFGKNTEISKEYKLYQTLTNKQFLSEGKTNNLIDTVISLSSKLNRTNLRNEKYNLIKEIKENYDLENFFKSRISNYKINAAIYNLIEAYNSNDFTNPQQVLSNKNTLLEYITKPTNNNKSEEIEEFLKEDKGTRLLIYKQLITSFNNKYENLLPEQKSLLKEYINSISNSPSLKKYINDKTIKLLKELKDISKKVDDDTTKIKLNEVINLLKPLPKNENVNDDDIFNLMNYFELYYELNKTIK